MSAHMVLVWAGVTAMALVTHASWRNSVMPKRYVELGKV